MWPAAGERRVVYNRQRPRPARAFSATSSLGAHGQAATPREAAQLADIVFCCVGNDDDLRSVTLGADGGGLLADHTTWRLPWLAVAAQNGLRLWMRPFLVAGQVHRRHAHVMCGGSADAFAD
jgi:3-hydroxyisobutyrate dehydrogenase-like beta-hydroxyacid dehydrogenase